MLFIPFSRSIFPNDNIFLLPKWFPLTFFLYGYACNEFFKLFNIWKVLYFAFILKRYFSRVYLWRLCFPVLENVASLFFFCIHYFWQEMFCHHYLCSSEVLLSPNWRGKALWGLYVWLVKDTARENLTEVSLAKSYPYYGWVITKTATIFLPSIHASHGMFTASPI